MHIELTVAHDGHRRDVAIAAPEAGALGDVLRALGPAVGADPGSAVWAGDRRLDPAAPLADAGLRVGAVLTIGSPPPPRALPAVLALQVVGGPAAGAITALGRGRLLIGRDRDCDVCLPDPDVSRHHAALEIDAATITVHDLGSTNGTTVAGRPVRPGGAAARPGDLIALGDSLLTVEGPIGAPAALQPTRAGTALLLRPPRRYDAVPDVEIVLPARSSAVRPRGAQWLAALLPAAAGAAIAVVAGAPQFLLFALLSPILMISTALGDRVHWRRERRRDAATYRRRRAAADDAVAVGLAAEAAARRRAAPDPAALGRHVALPSSRVWERRRDDADALHLRLGTARLPSTLRVRHGPTVSSAGRLQPVPLMVGLRRGPLGVAGPGPVTAAHARWLVGQLAALHSPADVELTLLLSADRAPDWSWARWLPHVHGRVAVGPDAWLAVASDLGRWVEARRHDRRRAGGEWAGPWHLLVIDRAAGLADVPGLAALLDGGCDVGLTAICVADDVSALPPHCASVVRVDGVTGTRLVLRAAGEANEIVGVIDQVTPEWSDDVARGLAPLVDAGAAGSSAIPDRCGLLDTLGLDRAGSNGPDPGRIEGRWAASTGGGGTALGRGADGPLTIDLVADGPHALIAGTTGSGKSELLQTLVAGLAANHPPDAMNFLLIDYKGGAAFADCARLPHTAGVVTDLDPYLTERALRSLNSELRRRERLFAAAGAADLADYRRAKPAIAAEPIARLVIVVDEFATLADELPEFVHGLVAVAQRGRSLGVHLVLATQRPGGSVSAEIRANTSLRIALRVTDAAESSDVVGVPDAAAIERRLPGRACLRTGSSFAAFQVAHPGTAGAPDPDAVTVEALGDWRRPGQRDRAGPITDIARLVQAITAAAERRGFGQARGPWRPPLPDGLPRTELGPADPPTAIGVARIDQPDEQMQAVLGFDVSAGATLLAAGGGGSGRTTLLAGLALGAAERFDAAALHLHVIDGTGTLATALSPLPHSATVLGPDDLALAPRLLHRLEAECTRRGRRGSPRLVLLIDGWPTVLAALADLDAATCVDTLANLLRIGPAAGLSVALTGDRSTLTLRFSGGFAERLLLRLPDAGDYALAGIAARRVPSVMPPGRALRAVDGAALQIAHAGAVPGIDALTAAVTAQAVRGPRPDRAGVISIRPLPAHVPLAALPVVAGRLRIGLAGDESEPLTLDLFAGSARLLVAGPPRSGRTTVLCSLAEQACGTGITVQVAAPERSALAATARRLSLPVISPDAHDAPAPAGRTLLLVDDSEAFADTAAGDRLTGWLRTSSAPLAAVVAGRADELATSYRGVAAEVRRSRCGILLRPGPVDGELLGARLPRRPSSGPPGRGVAIGEPAWGPLFDEGEPVPLQVAAPAERQAVGIPMWGYR